MIKVIHTSFDTIIVQTRSMRDTVREAAEQ